MNEYHVLKELEHNPAHTQRSLAEKLGVSLGKANYVLAGLVNKGIIKARKIKNHPDKIRWQYVLTAEGMREKVRITRKYLRKRMLEFDEIQKEIVELKREVDISDLHPIIKVEKTGCE